uniref:Uncharacterized protein n=1 Tax=Globodera rostochiensis TaxID=31243 RepID=A0A914H2V9_GLORO
MSESDSSKKNMGAEKENTLPAANTSKQSNSADSEEERLQNEIQVKCLCSDGYVMVSLALMSQSELGETVSFRVSCFS